jgi:hypothetical protein
MFGDRDILGLEKTKERKNSSGLFLAMDNIGMAFSTLIARWI